MVDRQFIEAKLLYDLVIKGRLPENKDSLSKIVPFLGFSTKIADLLPRLNRLMCGLPKEDEFIALAVWMEKCKFAHKLGQEQFPVSSSDKYGVPDIFAVFDINGQEVPVLIEVKFRQHTLPLAKLKFTDRYYSKLNNYANLLGLPLLIAWKVSGYWVLFDIHEMQHYKSTYYIDWSAAMKADLMFLLLDSVLVFPKSGVSFTIVLEDLGPTEHKMSAGKERLCKCHSVRFLDPNGNPISKISWPQFILWMFADHEEKQSRHDNFIELTFEVPEDPPFLPTYTLLPIMLFEMRAEERRPRNWYDVIKKRNFSPISYSQFKQAIQDGLGIFFQYVFQIVPHNRPDFLPAR